MNPYIKFGANLYRPTGKCVQYKVLCIFAGTKLEIRSEPSRNLILKTPYRVYCICLSYILNSLRSYYLANAKYLDTQYVPEVALYSIVDECDPKTKLR